MKISNSDLIQVLWVENDPKVIELYPLKAFDFNIELIPFPCWDDAKTALDDDFDRWSAIILDAKCKHHKDSEDNAIRFLGEALKDISVIIEKHGRLVPWYILSGGAETEISDSINDDRLKWDADWKDKKFYSKNTDTEILFKRIRVHAIKSPRIQIHEMYRNVFNAIEECNIDDNGYNALEDLLIPIHFPHTIVAKDYNDKFEKGREVLEYIFRSMSSYGILPEWGKQVNLRWSSCILGGKNATRKNRDEKDEIVIECKKQILPRTIVRILKEMIEIIPAFCHSDSGDKLNINKEEYFKCVDDSTMLLKSFAFQLCDIIIWYRNYLKDNKNIAQNKQKWYMVND